MKQDLLTGYGELFDPSREIVYSNEAWDSGHVGLEIAGIRLNLDILFDELKLPCYLLCFIT
jgi:hypothetical protein